ncbi:hypothetical protein JHN52_10375 [Streptomyces sp. MBT97]|uniref:hypothetical protein n=1 Tax=Streptomyces sp. MBT97 TaxID=2800411 RepID=UPI00190BD64A|nr:hypothetical protein [Streptomyces sp. MBT97]MBK3633349.1 hypothetical protein [Streptomyces sp. MBT97]
MASNQQTRPVVGEVAMDSASGRIGVVMGEIGGRVQMRPVRGGREWDAMPGGVVALSACDELSARLAVRDHDGRALL